MVEEIVIVSGLSGSGKSTAIRVLEDLQYFCVDNLPLPLLSKFIELGAAARPEFRKAAFVMDVRAKDDLNSVCSYVAELRKYPYWQVRVLFFDAADDVLLKRFIQTRRRHPIDTGQSLQERISLERKQLEPMRRLADRLIDTTHLNVHELKTIIKENILEEGDPGSITIRVCSFGFRYGLPPEADLVFDVRFMPNPYFQSELKMKSGEDADVQEFIFSQERGKGFIEHWKRFLNWLLPRYVIEGKSYLTIAFGCTGGRHRSVAMAQLCHQWLREQKFTCTLTHRDMDRPLA